MRESAGAVLAQVFLTLADTAETLINHDAVTWRQIQHLITDLHDGAGDLVSEDLRMLLERDRKSPIIDVVVRLPGVDVIVGATESDRIHLNHCVCSTEMWHRYFPDHHRSGRFKDTGPHHS